MIATLPTETSTPSSIRIASARVESIDLLRGIVMIIMALDHVRDYFHRDAFLFNPLDLDKTSAALFFTRWITHFCAPVFVFLAGTSAFLVGRRKGTSELSSFLFKRGLWLLVLEFTIINFSWFFNPQFKLMALTVIWALGIGMIILSFAVRLPFNVILALGVIFVFGHNMLDGVHVAGDGISSIAWALLHEQKVFQAGHFIVFVGYPILPWTGVMFLGYCFGKLYAGETNADQRKKLLIQLGIASIVAFVILRTINIYGDPFARVQYDDISKSVLSFLNVTKYPPSLDYLMVTLGPAFLVLAFTERVSWRLAGYVIALGRVPMFYYVVHLYLIHIIAVVAALLTGYQLQDMVFVTWVTDSPNLKGYGFSLAVVYVVWAAVVAALFPICVWYDRYKIANREKWWLSYM